MAGEKNKAFKGNKNKVPGLPPYVTHMKIKSIIMQFNETPPNADIEYFCGYLDGANFVSCGVDHLHIEDKAAVLDDKGNETSPAVTALTDLVSALNSSPDIQLAAENYLIANVGE